MKLRKGDVIKTMGKILIEGLDSQKFYQIVHTGNALIGPKFSPTYYFKKLNKSGTLASKEIGLPAHLVDFYLIDAKKEAKNCIKLVSKKIRKTKHIGIPINLDKMSRKELNETLIKMTRFLKENKKLSKEFKVAYQKKIDYIKKKLGF